MTSSQPASTPGAQHILIACVGNIFLGDDGFGVEVARRLATRHYPPGVEVVDFGIRGVELAYRLLDGCDTLVLVDAVPRGGTPGTLYLIEPDTLPSGAETSAAHTPPARSALDAHSMDPMKTLAFAYQLGARPRRILLIGCEPDLSSIPDADGALRIGLSAPAQASVEEAVKMVDALVARLCAPVEATDQKGEAYP